MEIEKTESASTFLGSLADRLGATARASTIFGEPVVRENVTVIPVARARWGFGGGAGRHKDEDGAGGGGGAEVTPIGFIEIKNGAAEFRRIKPISAPLLVAGGLSFLLLLRATLRR